MSFTFIGDFQNHIYKTLLENEAISASVNKIYFGAVQDGVCPFLLINVTKVLNLSHHVEQIYSVDFQISAYAKDHNHRLLVPLADKVIKAIDHSEIIFATYKISGIKANEVYFEKAKDLVLNKLAINYKALVNRKNYD